MKILFYLPTPGGLTGAPRRLLTLANALKYRGVEVAIVKEGDSELAIEASKTGLETPNVALSHILSLRGGALFGGGLLFRLRTLFSLLVQNVRFRRAVGWFDADVVWVRGSKGIAFGGFGALLSRRPLVWDVDFELPSKGMVRWLHRFGLWAAEVVVFQYKAAAEGIFGQELAQRYAGKFHTLIPGIDLDSIRRFREQKAQGRKRADEPFRILQVGTICDRKNQLLVLEALATLKVSGQLEGTEIRAQFVGGLSDQEYTRGVRQFILDNKLDDIVEIVGWRNDVHELMSQADLVVMSSKDEGVPNAVQETMFIGTPVIASPAGGLPEIIDDGRTGWIVPLGDVEAWAERINFCIRQRADCERAGLCASSYAEENFGTDDWTDKYLSIFKACK